MVEPLTTSVDVCDGSSVEETKWRKEGVHSWRSSPSLSHDRENEISSPRSTNPSSPHLIPLFGVARSVYRLSSFTYLDIKTSIPYISLLKLKDSSLEVLTRTDRAGCSSRRKMSSLVKFGEEK